MAPLDHFNVRESENSSRGDPVIALSRGDSPERASPSAWSSPPGSSAPPRRPAQERSKEMSGLIQSAFDEMDQALANKPFGNPPLNVHAHEFVPLAMRGDYREWRGGEHVMRHTTPVLTYEEWQSEGTYEEWQSPQQSSGNMEPTAEEQ